MTMDALAAEFPDIFHQFIEIVPDPNKPDQRIYETEDVETTNATNSILLEHDYGKKSMLKDANDNGSIANLNSNVIISSDSFINTTFSTEESFKDSGGAILVQESVGIVEESDTQEQEEESSIDLDNTAPLPDEIDEVLEDFADLNSNMFKSNFEIEKRSWGCSWSEFTSNCHHGHSCPFIRKILGLDTFGSTNSMQSAIKTLPLPTSQPAGAAAGQNFVLLKRTQNGFVRYQNTGDQFKQTHTLHSDQERISGSVQTIPSSFGSLASVYQQAQHSEAHSDQAMADISNKPRLYRPPPNSILIKVPQVSAVTNERAMLCDDCDSKFADRKSLVKHTRNQHQIYQCHQCGESTIGYYRMASHTKKNHSKEPVFYCNCGRNFSEKRAAKMQLYNS